MQKKRGIFHFFPFPPTTEFPHLNRTHRSLSFVSYDSSTYYYVIKIASRSEVEEKPEEEHEEEEREEEEEEEEAVKAKVSRHFFNKNSQLPCKRTDRPTGLEALIYYFSSRV